jgi:hypothetical protein
MQFLHVPYSVAWRLLFPVPMPNHPCRKTCKVGGDKPDAFLFWASHGDGWLVTLSSILPPVPIGW